MSALPASPPAPLPRGRDANPAETGPATLSAPEVRRAAEALKGQAHCLSDWADQVAGDSRGRAPRSLPLWQPTLGVGEIRMSQSAATAPPAETVALERLCTSIRGKLQFMDYLVRAAVADVERFRGEADAGTQIFLRQLVEMHASNLAVECENMRLMGELCNSLETAVASTPLADPAAPFRNGDAA